MVKFVPCPLFPGEILQYPLDRRLCGPQSRSGHDSIETKSNSPKDFFDLHHIRRGPVVEKHVAPLSVSHSATYIGAGGRRIIPVCIRVVVFAVPLRQLL